MKEHIADEIIFEHGKDASCKNIETLLNRNIFLQRLQIFAESMNAVECLFLRKSASKLY